MPLSQIGFLVRFCLFILHFCNTFIERIERPPWFLTDSFVIGSMVDVLGTDRCWDNSFELKFIVINHDLHTRGWRNKQTNGFLSERMIEWMNESISIIIVKLQREIHFNIDRKLWRWKSGFCETAMETVNGYDVM